jgi:3'(2'), 5'-bisphosphate nucleotidase
MLSNKDINYLIKICWKAGEEVLKFLGDADISYKDDRSPVTEADLISNKIIIDGLRRFNLPIISEETSLDKNVYRYNKYWLIDPLDGTKEFINGRDEFTINIALIENRKPIFGIVSAPAKKDIWIGINYETKKKSYKLHFTEKLNTILCKKPDHLDLISLISHSHADRSKLDLFYKQNRLNIRNEIPVGSSLKICWIAEGKADIYPRLGPTMEWDTAAAQAILEGAGGYLLIKGEQPLFYGKADLKNPSFIAANFKRKFRF